MVKLKKTIGFIALEIRVVGFYNDCEKGGCVAPDIPPPTISLL